MVESDSSAMIARVRALQGERELRDCFISQLRHASQFSVGMALVTERGLALLRTAFERCLARGGRGRFLFGIDLPTDPNAIEILLALRKRYPMFDLRRFGQGRRVFHAKMSIFVRASGKQSGIIGSSNLTRGGLNDNHESNILIEGGAAVEALASYFDEHFLGAQAQQVDGAWLAEYRRLWKARVALRKRAESLRARLKARDKLSSSSPPRIKGYRFAFTGRIEGWPRSARLYPEVRTLGGFVAQSADRVSSADCLVHGEILGGQKTTQKLVRAHQKRIPIIREEHFLALLRKGRRAHRA